MIIPSNIKFKDQELKKEYELIKPRLKIILEDMALWVERHGFLFLITDLLSEQAEDLKLNRVSRSHTEGRAADIRVITWPNYFRDKFEKYFELKYSGWAAISLQTGKPNLILIHDNNNGLHCHIQVAPYKES